MVVRRRRGEEKVEEEERVEDEGRFFSALRLNFILS